MWRDLSDKKSHSPRNQARRRTYVPRVPVPSPYAGNEATTNAALKWLEMLAKRKTSSFIRYSEAKITLLALQRTDWQTDWDGNYLSLVPKPYPWISGYGRPGAGRPAQRAWSRPQTTFSCQGRGAYKYKYCTCSFDETTGSVAVWNNWQCCWYV